MDLKYNARSKIVLILTNSDKRYIMCKYCTAGKTSSWAVYQTSITIQLKASALPGITKNGKG